MVPTNARDFCLFPLCIKYLQGVNSATGYIVLHTALLMSNDPSTLSNYIWYDIEVGLKENHITIISDCFKNNPHIWNAIWRVYSFRVIKHVITIIQLKGNTNHTNKTNFFIYFILSLFHFFSLSLLDQYGPEKKKT